MASKHKVKVYLEQNRSGKFKKIEVYKDKDKEDTTLGFWVKLPNKQMVKIGEWIFTEDMELEDNPNPPEPPEPNEPKAPIVDADENANIAGNVNEEVQMSVKVTDANGNDTIKSIDWQQTLGTVDLLQDAQFSDGKRSCIIKSPVAGKFLFTVTATDDTGLTGQTGINVEIREEEQPPIPDGEFEDILATFGDSNSTKDTQIIFNAIRALKVKVLALGDYEYDEDFNDFIAKYGDLILETVLADKGNHDHTESESSSIEKANIEFWKWSTPAVGKAELGNIGIVAMDSQDDNILDKNDTQYKFVEEALKSFASKDFRIVTMHKPFRCPQTKHSEETEIRGLYEPLFLKYKVQLILGGHNHIQSVTKLLEGILRYAINGVCGNDLYQIKDTRTYIEWSQDDKFGYMIISRKKDGSQLKLKFMSISGEELHTVLIDKVNVEEPPLPIECPAGTHEENGVCVPDVIEPPATDVLWSSKAWNNNIERHLTGHHQFDLPHDDKFEVAAGEDRDWHILGNGKIQATGIRTRGYEHTVQEAGTWYEYTSSFIFNPSLINWSGEFFSRHNEQHPTAKEGTLLEQQFRYGGATFAIHRNKIEFDEEYWHNERDSRLSDSHSLSETLKDGELINVKVLGLKEIVSEDEIKFSFEIYVNDKLEWKKGFTTNHPEAARLEALYYRWRINGDDNHNPKDVETENWAIRAIQR